MKTRNAKELASIITLLLSKDYESVMLGISLFSDHYLITNYPKNKKFKVKLNYKGYHAPSTYCSSYSGNSAEFNKNQFLRMLASKSVDIRKKTCAIINFIYDNVDPRYIKNNNYKIKNPNYNDSLSRCLWGSSLDTIQVNSIKSYIWRTGRSTYTPLSKKKIRQIMVNNTRSYLSTKGDSTNDFIEECIEYDISRRFYGYNSTPWDVILDYKRYLSEKFHNKKEKEMYYFFSRITKANNFR